MVESSIRNGSRIGSITRGLIGEVAIGYAAEIMSGGGYSMGTQEGYDAFVEQREANVRWATILEQFYGRPYAEL